MNMEYFEEVDKNDKNTNGSDNKKKGSISRIILLPIIYLAVQVIVATFLTRMFLGEAGLEHKIIALTLVISSIITFFLIFLVMKKYRPYKEYFKFNKLSIKKTILIIISAFSFNFFIVSVIGLIDIEKYFPDYVELFEKLALPTGGILIFLAVGVLAPIVEELIFRGSIYNLLRNYFGTKTSIIIQALIFGFIHLNILQSSYAFVLGIVSGILYVKTNSIKSVLIFHIIFNMSPFLLTRIYIATNVGHAITLIATLIVSSITFMLAIKNEATE